MRVGLARPCLLLVHPLIELFRSQHLGRAGKTAAFAIVAMTLGPYGIVVYIHHTAALARQTPGGRPT